jgi:hypothetical protein
MAGTGKRKRESSSDAPGSSWPPPGSSWPRPPLRGAGSYEDDSSLSDYTEGGFLNPKRPISFLLHLLAVRSV